MMIYGTNFEVISARSKISPSTPSNTTSDSPELSTKMDGAPTKQITTANSKNSNGENEVATLATLATMETPATTTTTTTITTTTTTTTTPNNESVVASAVRAQPEGNATLTSTPNSESPCPRYYSSYLAGGDSGSPIVWKRIKLCAGSSSPCDYDGNSVICASQL